MSIETARSMPADFTWGAATASFQVEGAASADDRGESIWDRFCTTPGKVRNGDTGDVAFGEYVAAVVGRLGDRISNWITHNEPWVASWLGYGRGVHAPGRTNEADAVAAAHHLLLSHGRAVQIIRAETPAGTRVGITLNLTQVYPATGSETDHEAARRVDGFGNRWFLDPLFRGSYPLDVLAALDGSGPPVRDGDLQTIAAPIDFLGI